MAHDHLFSSATDKQVNDALIAFMTSPNARKALLLMEASRVQQFMIALMGPDVVEAYIAFEKSVTELPSQTEFEDIRTDREIIASKAQEAAEGAAETVTELECFVAVALMHLNEELPTSGFDSIVIDGDGGTGVWGNGVDLRCYGLGSKENRYWVRSFLRELLLDFDLPLDGTAIEFNVDHEEDETVNIPFRSSVAKEDRDRLMSAIRNATRNDAVWGS